MLPSGVLLGPETLAGSSSITIPRFLLALTATKDGDQSRLGNEAQVPSSPRMRRTPVLHIPQLFKDTSYLDSVPFAHLKCISALLLLTLIALTEFIFV